MDFDPGVNVLMPFEGVLTSKGFSTGGAVKQSLAGMDYEVTPESRGGLEGHTALRTAVTSLVRVHHLVCFEICQPSEAPATLLTMERSFSCVCDLVGPHTVLEAKAPVTFWALVGFHLRVYGQVSSSIS